MRASALRLLPTPALALLTLCLVPAPAGLAQEDSVTPAQIVALDECDPMTFNAALGPDFCKNVALAFAAPFATKFKDLFDEAAAGTPDPAWDFEPDHLTIKKGTPLVVVNQGGEPHTFTKVALDGQASGAVGGWCPAGPFRSRDERVANLQLSWEQ